MYWAREIFADLESPTSGTACIEAAGMLAIFHLMKGRFRDPVYQRKHDLLTDEQAFDECGAQQSMILKAIEGVMDLFFMGRAYKFNDTPGEPPQVWSGSVSMKGKNPASMFFLNGLPQEV